MYSSCKRLQGGCFQESDAMFFLCRISTSFGKSVTRAWEQNTVWRRYAARGKKRSWHVIGTGSIMQGVRNSEYFRRHNTRQKACGIKEGKQKSQWTWCPNCHMPQRSHSRRKHSLNIWKYPNPPISLLCTYHMAFSPLPPALVCV